MRLADEILSRWAPIMRSVDLKAGTTGRFEVTLDGELVFSKAQLKRHANPGEITAAFEKKLGAPLRWRSDD